MKLEITLAKGTDKQIITVDNLQSIEAYLKIGYKVESSKVVE